MKTQITLTMAILTIVALTSCEEVRTDWSNEESSKKHNELFESYNPAPQDDEQILQYAITQTDLDNVVVVDVTALDGVKTSPAHLCVYIESVPNESLSYTIKNTQGQFVTLPVSERIVVASLNSDNQYKYSLILTLPAETYGDYKIRVRTYTDYTYGVDGEKRRTYAYSTPTITVNYASKE